MYNPRFTKPEKGNKYYITKAKGGWSTAIVGNPTDPDCNVLSNCFSGDTKIITRHGVFRLDSLVDKEFYALSKDGIYRPARGGYYGRQPMYKIILGNGDSFTCTGNHRWYIKKNERLIVVPTIELKSGDIIPYSLNYEDEIDERGYYLGYYDLETPHFHDPLPILRGFIAGLMFTRGFYDKESNITINAHCEARAKEISQILSILSYRNEIFSLQPVSCKKEKFFVKIDTSFIPNSLFMKFGAIIPKKKKAHSTYVQEVKPLNYNDDAYCIQELETRSMVLEGCILTGQCVGYAFGRFNEIAGNTAMTYLQPVNAENFYAVAKSQGLKTGSEPQLGAVAVWQKGATLESFDGAGHVAVVEQINSDGSIITSESGYNCSNPFWTQKRIKGNGNWGADSNYKFLGFIYQPDGGGIAPTPTPAQRILKKGMYGEDVKEMQTKLAGKGYLRSNEIDGDFGTITLGGLLAFQFENNLEVDGACGPATQKALGM